MSEYTKVEIWKTLAQFAHKEYGCYLDEERNYYVCTECGSIIHPQDIIDGKYLCPFCEEI